ncbi:hypothetical protein ACTQ6A_14015 [Lachnospiraceae bacterium LCP25S3_G4]
MNCPKCKNEMELRHMEDGDFAICRNCRIKKRVVKKQTSSEQLRTKYSNIPDKEVRHKREKEMKSAYNDLMDVGKHEEPGNSYLVPIILGIVIVIVLVILAMKFYL